MRNIRGNFFEHYWEIENWGQTSLGAFRMPFDVIRKFAALPFKYSVSVKCRVSDIDEDI